MIKKTEDACCTLLHELGDLSSFTVAATTVARSQTQTTAKLNTSLSNGGNGHPLVLHRLEAAGVEPERDRNGAGETVVGEGGLGPVVEVAGGIFHGAS